MATAVVVISTATGAACSTNHEAQQSADTTPVSASSSVVQLGAADCPVNDAQWLTLTKQAGDEPTIHVPLTPGWTLAVERDPKQPTLRGLVANKGLRENGGTPFIQVTLNRVQDPAEPLDEVASGLVTGLGGNPTIGERSHADVCGNQVYRTDFAGLDFDGRSVPGTQLSAFTDVENATRWVAVALIVTTNLNNPGYVAQRDALLKGFHLSTP